MPDGDSEVPDLDEFDVCDCRCPLPAMVLDTGRCSRCGTYVLPTFNDDSTTRRSR